jgi:hypothetical protein
MCLLPDRAGDYLKVEGEAKAGLPVAIKVVKGELAGKVSYDTWKGIPITLDKYKTDPRQCALEMTKLLVPSFTAEPTKNHNPPAAPNITQRLETEIAQRLRVAKRKAEGDMLMHYSKVGFVGEVVLGPPTSAEVTYEEYQSKPLRALFVELKPLTPASQRKGIDACLSTIEAMIRRSQSEGKVDREYLNLVVADLNSMLAQRQWPE